MSKNPEHGFWNNPKVVKEFYNAEASPYWRDFLCGLKEPFSYRALDLGCGGGRNTELLVKKGFDTWACDFYELMLKATRRRIGILMGASEARKRIIKASMLNLPFENGCFDIVIANGIYHNTNSIDEFTRAVKETSRILKKGGFLCLNVFYRGIIAPELKEIKSSKHTFITPGGLHLTLIGKREVLRILTDFNIMPQGKIAVYKREVSTGVRSVLRGVFRKS
ncbi:MAG: class I SAM-dependent methyltransferase [Minisyncoccia bacterium]